MLQRESREPATLKRDESQQVTGCGFACTCLYLHQICATPFNLSSHEIPHDIHSTDGEKVAVDLWFIGP